MAIGYKSRRDLRLLVLLIVRGVLRFILFSNLAHPACHSLSLSLSLSSFNYRDENPPEISARAADLRACESDFPKFEILDESRAIKRTVSSGHLDTAIC